MEPLVDLRLRTYNLIFDSSKRNRNIYPNSCSFPVAVSNGEVDEVCDGIPNYVFAVSKVNTFGNYFVCDNQIFPDLPWIGTKICGSNQCFITCLSNNVIYNYSSKISPSSTVEEVNLSNDTTAILNNIIYTKESLPALSASSTLIYIKRIPLEITGTFSSGLVEGFLALDASASSVDDYYKGWWIWWIDFYSKIPVYSKIISYNGLTKRIETTGLNYQLNSINTPSLVSNGDFTSTSNWVSTGGWGGNNSPDVMVDISQPIGFETYLAFSHVIAALPFPYQVSQVITFPTSQCTSYTFSFYDLLNPYSTGYNILACSITFYTAADIIIETIGLASTIDVVNTSWQKYSFTTTQDMSNLSYAEIIIVGYNGTEANVGQTGPLVTKVSLVGNMYSVLLPPKDAYYELYSSQRNNYKALSLHGIDKTIEVFFVKLIALTLPTSILFNGHGGDLKDYPVVYVHLGNSKNSANGNAILSNNDLNNCFIVPVNTPNAVVPDSTFFRLTDCYMVLRMRLDLSQPIYMTIFLNTSEVIKFSDDFLPPLAPCVSLQTSAVFQLTMDCRGGNMCSDSNKRMILR